jgi:hypothetical protein
MEWGEETPWRSPDLEDTRGGGVPLDPWRGGEEERLRHTGGDAMMLAAVIFFCE